MNPALAESMVNAASLEITGKTEEALVELCRARDAGHQSPKLATAIGHLQFELGRFQAAAIAYEDVVRRDRDDSTSHYNLAVCLEKLGCWGEAAAAFRKAIEMDPRRAGAHLGLGISLLHLQQPGEALTALEGLAEKNIAE